MTASLEMGELSKPTRRKSSGIRPYFRTNRFKKIFAAAVDPDGLAGLGVKPYQANKLKGESGKFSKTRLKSMLDMLAKADYDYKTGAMSQYDALTAFVARAAGGVK